MMTHMFFPGSALLLALTGTTLLPHAEADACGILLLSGVVIALYALVVHDELAPGDETPGDGPDTRADAPAPLTTDERFRENMTCTLALFMP